MQYVLSALFLLCRPLFSTAAIWNYISSIFFHFCLNSSLNWCVVNIYFCYRSFFFVLRSTCVLNLGPPASLGSKNKDFTSLQKIALMNVIGNYKWIEAAFFMKGWGFNIWPCNAFCSWYGSQYSRAWKAHSFAWWPC